MNNEKQDNKPNVSSEDCSIIKKVKENGTITLDELVSELTKSGVTDIHFQGLNLNLGKLTMDNNEDEKCSDFDSESIKSFGSSILNGGILETKTPNCEAVVPSEKETVNKEVDAEIDKDYKLLSFIVEGNFEEDDITRLLSIVDTDKIKSFIVDKVEKGNLPLEVLVHLLMDLHN